MKPSDKATPRLTFEQRQQATTIMESGSHADTAFELVRAKTDIVALEQELNAFREGKFEDFALRSLDGYSNELDALRTQNADFASLLDLAEAAMTAAAPHCPRDLEIALNERAALIRAALKEVE